MLLPAIFWVSLSVIAFEVLLVRIFAISQWNHLAFMVISIALFGFAVSGTLLSTLNARRTQWASRMTGNHALGLVAALYTITATVALILINLIPLDYLRLPVEPMQGAYLLLTYLALATPFGFAGLMIALGYTSLPAKTGVIYLVTMGGSALGALLPVPLLPLLGESRLALIVVALPLLTWLWYRRASTPRSDAAHASPLRQRRLPLVMSCAALGMVALLLTPGGQAWIDVRPTPYKRLSHFLQFPHTHITSTTGGLRGRIDRIESPYVRFAPGISLKHGSPLPRQDAFFKDGDEQYTLYQLAPHQPPSFPKATVTYAGYHLVPNPAQVLIVQGAGGLAIPCALAAEAQHITVLHSDPRISGMFQHHYQLPVLSQNPRTYLARTQALFDIIHVEDWGSSLPEAAVLNQSHLLTIEAIGEYLRHLTPNGLLIISRKLLLPPADAVRQWATAWESLKREGATGPDEHLAVIRNWDTYTLLIARQPLRETERLIHFARQNNFDLVFLKGTRATDANRYSQFDRAYHYTNLEKLMAAYQAGQPEVFYRAYPLDVAPQTDGRPFPNRFLKWSRLWQMLHSADNPLYSLLVSGEIVIMVVLVETLIVAALLLLLPVLLIAHPKRIWRFSMVAYFATVGAGFILVEMYFIKSFTLIFADPVISFTVVLAGMLLASAIGGLCSQRMGLKHLRAVLVLVVVWLALLVAGQQVMIEGMLGLKPALRWSLAFLLLFPGGFLLGVPFPLALRLLLQSPAQRAYAWSINGCASVICAVIAAQIAISLGIPMILTVAIAAYGIALLTARPLEA